MKWSICVPSIISCLNHLTDTCCVDVKVILEELSEHVSLSLSATAAAFSEQVAVWFLRSFWFQSALRQASSLMWSDTKLCAWGLPSLSHIHKHTNITARKKHTPTHIMHPQHPLILIHVMHTKKGCYSIILSYNMIYLLNYKNVKIKKWCYSKIKILFSSSEWNIFFPSLMSNLLKSNQIISNLWYLHKVSIRYSVSLCVLKHTHTHTSVTRNMTTRCEQKTNRLSTVVTFLKVAVWWGSLVKVSKGIVWKQNHIVVMLPDASKKSCRTCLSVHTLCFLVRWGMITDLSCAFIFSSTLNQ